MREKTSCLTNLCAYEYRLLARSILLLFFEKLPLSQISEGAVSHNVLYYQHLSNARQLPNVYPFALEDQEGRSSACQ